MCVDTPQCASLVASERFITRGGGARPSPIPFLVFIRFLSCQRHSRLSPPVQDTVARSFFFQQQTWQRTVRSFSDYHALNETHWTTCPSTDTVVPEYDSHGNLISPFYGYLPTRYVCYIFVILYTISTRTFLCLPATHRPQAHPVSSSSFWPVSAVSRLVATAYGSLGRCR